MKEYQIIIDLEADVSERQVELLTGFIKEIVDNSIFKDVVSDVYWDEV